MQFACIDKAQLEGLEGLYHIRGRRNFFVADNLTGQVAAVTANTQRRDNFIATCKILSSSTSTSFS